MARLSEVFVRTTPFGVLAGFPLPVTGAPIPEGLHDEERALAAAMFGRRRTEWVGGRLAFWKAAEESGWPRGALRIGARGEPMLPEGLAGSISHKSSLAVALVARSNADGATLGVDLETMAPERPSIEEIALRPEEREALRLHPAPMRWARIVVAFAVKEALYKALHPRVHRYVRYDEASVLFTAGGAPEIRLHLDGGARFATAVHLEPVESYVLACVRVGPPK